MLEFILTLLTPLQKLMQKLGKPEPKISEQFAKKARYLLEDGDILLSREDWRLTSLFIKGFWKHASIYRKGHVIEAIGDYMEHRKKKNGVREVEFFKWVYSKDHVIILRPSQLGKDIRHLASLFALAQVGKKYDYTFKKGKGKIYCSELCALSYNEMVPGYFEYKYQILPQAFYDDKRLIEICSEINK